MLLIYMVVARLTSLTTRYYGWGLGRIRRGTPHLEKYAMCQPKVGEWVIILYTGQPMCIIGQVISLRSHYKLGIVIDTYYRHDPKGHDQHYTGHWPSDTVTIQIEPFGGP